MKKTILIFSVLLSSFAFANNGLVTNDTNTEFVKTINNSEKALLKEALKGNIKTVNSDGFTWYDSCGGSHYFEFFKYFSMQEIIEEIWSMDAEYCP